MGAPGSSRPLPQLQLRHCPPHPWLLWPQMPLLQPCLQQKGRTGPFHRSRLCTVQKQPEMPGAEGLGGICLQ